MSIQSEIDRIRANVSSAYDAVEEKGGTIPSAKTSANLANAIGSIEAGSGGGGSLPYGTIVIWSGSADNIPFGYHICDGEAGTPDLRDRFVLGAGPTYPVGETGGEERVTLTVEQMPSHSHTVRVFNNPNTTAGTAPGRGNGDYTDNAGAIQKVGGDKPHNNMPPYYALCYIMRIGMTVDGLTVESYTTDDGWHVRKWSDGYLEMTYSKVVELLSTGWTRTHGTLTLYATTYKPPAYPITITELYSEKSEIEGCGYGIFFGSSEGASSSQSSDPARFLTNPPDYAIFTSKAPSYTVYGYASTELKGRWK